VCRCLHSSELSRWFIKRVCGAEKMQTAAAVDKQSIGTLPEVKGGTGERLGDTRPSLSFLQTSWLFAQGFNTKLLNLPQCDALAQVSSMHRQQTLPPISAIEVPTGGGKTPIIALLPFAIQAKVAFSLVCRHCHDSLLCRNAFSSLHPVLGCGHNLQLL
jgi:hypothetical protein